MLSLNEISQFDQTIPENTQAEFSKALALVQQFTPASSIEQCLEQLRACFSKDTYCKYTKQVTTFIDLALQQLTKKVHAMTIEVLGPKKRPPLQLDPFLSNKLDQLLKTASTLQCLTFDSEGILKHSIPRQDLLKSFSKDCEEYKASCLAEQRNVVEIDREIAEAQQQAQGILQTTQERIEKSLAEIKTVQGQQVLHVSPVLSSSMLERTLRTYHTIQQLLGDCPQELLSGIVLLSDESTVDEQVFVGIRHLLQQEDQSKWLQQYSHFIFQLTSATNAESLPPLSTGKKVYDTEIKAVFETALLFLSEKTSPVFAADRRRPLPQHTSAERFISCRDLYNRSRHGAHFANSNPLIVTMLDEMSDTSETRSFLIAMYATKAYEIEQLAILYTHCKKRGLANTPLFIEVLTTYTALSLSDIRTSLRALQDRPEPECAEFVKTFKKTQTIGEGVVLLHCLVTGEKLQAPTELARVFNTILVQSTMGIYIVKESRSFLLNLSSKQLILIKTLVTKWPYVLHEGHIQLLTSIVHDDKLSDFVHRIPHKSISDLRHVVACYTWLYSPKVEDPSLVVPTLERSFPSLLPAEKYLLTKKVHPGERIPLLSFAEAAGCLESEIASLPLSDVPIEPFMRFIGSKPFPQMKAWLEVSISTPTGTKTRLETISPEQKKAIFSRFVDADFGKPLPIWLDLFHSKPEDFPSLGVSPQPPERRADHNRLQHQIDDADPTSLFLQSLRPGDDLTSAIRSLVTSALPMAACGGRRMLTWGNPNITTSPCIAQDSPPLFARYCGQLIALHSRGLFNDFSLDVAAYSLRSRLLALKKDQPAEFSWLGTSENFSPEGQEISLELARIVDHLRERYPDIEKQKVFFETLQKAYTCLKSKMPTYDRSNYTHRRIFLIKILLHFVRKAIVTVDGDCTTIEMPTAKSRFRLRELKPDSLKIFEEDNPGQKNLSEMIADYPTYTLSPITPLGVATPTSVRACIAAINALNEEQFQQLLTSCEQVVGENDEVPMTTLFAAWRKYWPVGVDISSAEPFINALVGHYQTKVDTAVADLLSNKQYLLDRRNYDDFCPKELVPIHLQCLGNFISIICASFVPYTPTKHDGNCGVNSFLLGVYGVDAYNDTNPNQRNLNNDIQQFRDSIVDYAQANISLLQTKGLEEARLRTLIANYRSLDWSGTEVWAIASEVYNRHVNVYTVEGLGWFKTDEHKVVLPSTHYEPTTQPSHPPINLLLWEVHYEFLAPRMNVVTQPPIAQ